MGKKKGKKGPLAVDVSASDEVEEETNTKEESKTPNNEQKEEVQEEKGKNEEITEDSSEDEENQKESKGKMTQRHKREIKELQKKTQAMLHGVNKNDKKAKQQIADQIKKMEEDLKKQHEKELKEIESVKEIEPIEVKENKNQIKEAKQKRRRAALLAQEQEREKRILEEKKGLVSQRDVENQSLRKKLEPLKFTIKEIPADGNCLYSAIADQQMLNGLSVTKNQHQLLRNMVAEYMRKNPDEFMPFIDDEEDGEITKEKFEEYCNKIASTSTWGGQLELKALVHVLKSPITIHTADAKALEMGKEYEEISKPLNISFHKFAYSLGEHYNSVVPINQVKEDAF